MVLSKFYCLLPATVFLFSIAKAQTDFHDYSMKYVGELGIEAGTAEYFGDLNPNGTFRSMKPEGSIFFRYFFNNYFGASAHLLFAQLGYSDAYSKDSVQHIRNLSFDTNIFEFSLQGDFNFFNFEPGSLTHRFTPYFTLGLGALHFNPYTYYQNKKYYLQPLGTEGQGSPLYPHRKKYSLWTYDIPMGIGLKYNLNRQWNVAFCVTYHFTGTDYLDDVSTTYAGPAAFPPGPDGKQTIASILQDRSGVYGPPIGEAGRQRGNSSNKDQFINIGISLAWLFENYHCPVF